MFGWESMPMLIEVGVIAEEARLRRKLTPEERSEAYRVETKRVFDALLKAGIERDLNWANYCEAQRKTKQTASTIKFAFAAGAVAFIIAAALGL